MQWRKVSIIGLGLLGGSLGLACKQRALAARVEGYARREITVAESLEAGAVDAASTSLAQVVAGADLVILCTPLCQMAELARQMLPFLNPDALVTDVGSVKGELLRELQPIFAQRGIDFVGSHPMAGSEKKGVTAARADLFGKAVCVVTPSAQNHPVNVEKVREFWKAVGSKVLELTPELHDQLVSRSSHLPHLLAAALANYVLAERFPKQQSGLCAGGFRDSTRIASGSPEMWRDICLTNSAPIHEALDEFIIELQQFQKALATKDSEKIELFFSSAKNARDQWLARASTATPE
ncbi:MAG: prephenate dehydrogenase [Verrucomicrobiales bacterium]